MEDWLPDEGGSGCIKLVVQREGAVVVVERITENCKQVCFEILIKHVVHLGYMANEVGIPSKETSWEFMKNS